MKLRFLSAALLLVSALTPALAQTGYPNKPLRLFVGYPPGQASDIFARLLADNLGRALGQPVVVENRPGQAGSIGLAAAAKSPADGYTIGFSSTAAVSSNLYLYKSIPYDPLKDFAPIAMVGYNALFLVANPAVPAGSFQELIALAKAKPDSLNYASPGNGSMAHLTMELLKLDTGARITHIPYKGSSQAIAELIAGQTAVAFDTPAVTVPFIRSGKLKLLAVTSPKRSALFPDVPTVAESGMPGFESGAWYGLLFPAGTPRPIVMRLNEELNRIVRQPEVVEKLVAIGVEPRNSTPEEFVEVIRNDNARWGKVIREAGIRGD